MNFLNNNLPIILNSEEALKSPSNISCSIDFLVSQEKAISRIACRCSEVRVYCFSREDFDESGTFTSVNVVRYQQCVLHQIKGAEEIPVEERNQNLGNDRSSQRAKRESSRKIRD